MRHIKSYANDNAIQEAVDSQTLGKPYVALNEATGEIDWNGKEETDYSKMYLTIEVLSSGRYRIRCWDGGKKYSYSINEGEWIEKSGAFWEEFNAGDTVRFKSIDAPDGLFDGFDGDFKAYGNILSMKYGDNFADIKNDSYKFTFFGTNIVDASNLVLPATTLESGCYDSMFNNCRKLTSAPALPATTLAQGCYANMFENCTSLTTAPVLPATTLESSCYGYMFQGCEKINYVKCLAAVVPISATDLTIDWLDGVASTGTFVKAAGVEWWASGTSGIPSGWTVIEE